MGRILSGISKAIVIGVILFMLSAQKVNAQEFRNDYQVEYFLNESQNIVTARVKFTIRITNLTSELYVKQFAISFPLSFEISGIRAFDDKKEITPKLEEKDLLRKISLEFSDPNVGRGSVNNFYLEFDQQNLFVTNGNIWEVIIPTIENKGNTDYKIIVHLPSKSGKKISISKPKPDVISGNDIIWNNPTSRTIYAVFGDRQNYDVNLVYHLENSKLVPVYTDIAFPPDTLYQKTYVSSIDPEPNEVHIDIDGNFLGRYYLKPRDRKEITYKGTVSVFANPQDHIIEYEQREKKQERSSLTAQKTYWELEKTPQIEKIGNNPRDIYSFVVSSLTYDYNKVGAENKRLGATGALISPKQAVCMEFTDLFVALARMRGIPSREIEGYGVTQDPRLRPLSTKSDVLHSWPEYFDTASGLWKPVDPTWENTSGIDYFSAFDLNHLTFVIHGEDPAYPPPAGAYKIGDSKDVQVTPVSDIPNEYLKLSFSELAIPKTINDQKNYKLSFKVRNEGNVFLWNPPLSIDSQNLLFSPSTLSLAPLAPGQTKTIQLNFRSQIKNKKTTGTIQIPFPNQEPFRASIEIVPFYYQVGVNLAIAIFITSIGFLIFLFIRKKRTHRGRKH